MTDEGQYRTQRNKLAALLADPEVEVNIIRLVYFIMVSFSCDTWINHCGGCGNVMMPINLIYKLTGLEYF